MSDKSENVVVPFAAFLERRQRRDRIAAELRAGDPANGAAKGDPGAPGGLTDFEGPSKAGETPTEWGQRTTVDRP